MNAKSLLEREDAYGILETRMAEQFRDRQFTVRNLSWSGDTPLGVSRASFDKPAKGWERLQEQIALVRPTVAFLGWFGPRGLASIVFAVIVVEQSHLPHLQTILLTTYATVGLSVLAHGLSAARLAERYAGWYGSHRRDRLPTMESVPALPHRPRGPLAQTPDASPLKSSPSNEGG